jgi:hypothetical protein
MMLDTMAHFAILALFNLGAGEVILILALILIFYGDQKLPGLTQGVDQRAQDAGRTLGGIYGKRAAQALTPDNQTGELYDPAAFHRRSRKHKALRNLVQRCRVIWLCICKLVLTCIRVLLNWRKRL